MNGASRLILGWLEFIPRDADVPASVVFPHTESQTSQGISTTGQNITTNFLICLKDNTCAWLQVGKIDWIFLLLFGNCLVVFHPCFFFSCSVPFQRRDCSRQEAPGDSAAPPVQQHREMEAIKKKMQAMKVEKDNACDRVDVCEEQCKAARVSSSFPI